VQSRNETYDQIVELWKNIRAELSIRRKSIEFENSSLSSQRNSLHSIPISQETSSLGVSQTCDSQSQPEPILPEPIITETQQKQSQVSQAQAESQVQSQVSQTQTQTQTQSQSQSQSQQSQVSQAESQAQQSSFSSQPQSSSQSERQSESSELQSQPPSQCQPQLQPQQQALSQSQSAESQKQDEVLIKSPSQSLSPQFKPEIRSQRFKDPLTKEDWDLVLKGAKTEVYSKGETVICEGQQYQRLYHIGRGSCLIKRDNKILRRLEQGEMFGEISFLEGGGASATIEAGESGVELYIIEGKKTFHFLQFN
jgi:hypothetical protein